MILNLFQDNVQRWFVILKQVQDDERLGVQVIRAPLEVSADNKKGGAFLHRLF
ncbi:MAG: hypothetical protein RL251_1146 [Pseudomonadota bacterium]